jgi:hypothetical protein
VLDPTVYINHRRLNHDEWSQAQDYSRV